MGLTLLQGEKETTQMVGVRGGGARHSEGENNQYRMSGRRMAQEAREPALIPLPEPNTRPRLSATSRQPLRSGVNTGKRR